MENLISTTALQWVQDLTLPKIDPNYFCETRDIFQARLDKMAFELLKTSCPNTEAYLLTAIAGEIGNNSFDHNIGNWQDVMGIFFGYDFSNATKYIVLADRGQGIFTTLKKVKPELQNDTQALETAFTEKLSGRAPENRGNGLKFVFQTIQELKIHLTFRSGFAQAELNEKIIIQKIDNSIHGCFALLQF